MEEGHIFPTFVYLYRVGSCPGETGTREGHYDPARLSASHIRYRRRARLLSQWLVPDKQHQPRWFSRWLEKSEAGPLLKPNTWKLLLLLLAFPPPKCTFFSFTPRPPRGRDMHASRYPAERWPEEIAHPSRRNARCHLHGVAAFCAIFSSASLCKPGHPPVVVQLEYACRRRFCPAARARQHSNFIGGPSAFHDATNSASNFSFLFEKFSQRSCGGK